MKKIGIVTIAIKNTYNYGNRLQAFALQEFLRTNGYEPETILHRTDYVQSNVAVKSGLQLSRVFKQSLWQSLDDACRIANRKIQNSRLRSLRQSRIDKFEQFSSAHIKYTEKEYQTEEDLMQLAARYQCFVTGSDQVWNPYYEGADPFYYLTFAPKGKRIAYAPSISVEQIPQTLKSRIGQWIRGLDCLSIREEEGELLLQREYGVAAQVVCDPVFLLPPQKWHDVAVRPARKAPYFAVYILGKKTVETKQTIRRLERVFQAEAVDLFANDDPRSVFAGPGEFLGWIENAEFVLTDSFHGAAFAVIFEKPMVLLDRDAEHSMNSRTDHLLKVLDLKDRNAQSILEHPDEMNIDYSRHSKNLAQHKQRSEQYLLTAIDRCVNIGVEKAHD